VTAQLGTSRRFFGPKIISFPPVDVRLLLRASQRQTEKRFKQAKRTHTRRALKSKSDLWIFSSVSPLVERFLFAIVKPKHTTQRQTQKLVTKAGKNLSKK
jgi:hypothetical protein